MATQKPISTISYNSESFLLEKLEALRAAHIIQAWQFIKHKGEDGDKDHIHLRVEPNRRIDQMELTEKFKEYVGNDKKPLGVRPWRHSKEEDWYLYAVHDEEYLSLKYGAPEKGEKLPYSWTEIRAPEDYDVEIAFIRAKASLKHTAPNMVARLQGGENPIDLVKQGENPHQVRVINDLIKSTDYVYVVSQLKDLQEQHERLLADYERLCAAVSASGFELIESLEGVQLCRKKE